MRQAVTNWRAELTAIVDEVPPDAVPDVLGELARLTALLQMRLHVPRGNGRPSPTPLRSLTAKEVATVLGMSRNWVYRHAKELGGAKLSEGALRFPEQDVRRYVATRR
jgi:predicted DNA-binding transcriptional regulator AlpA